MSSLTPSDVKKLKALHYEVEDVRSPNMNSDNNYRLARVDGTRSWFTTEAAAWIAAKAHAQSPEGMKSTMADKIEWLAKELRKEPMGTVNAIAERFGRELIGVMANKKPEMTADELFWGCA